MDVEPSSMASFSVIGAWSPRADASCLVHNCHNIEEMCSGLGPVVNGLPAACPYVSIRYGDKTAKTITLRNTVQPIWNSPCFAFEHKEHQDSVLVELFDNNTGTLMGTLSIETSRFNKDSGKRLELPLKSTKKYCQSSANIALGMTPERAAHTPTPQIKGQTNFNWGTGVRKFGKVGAKFEERIPVVIFPTPDALAKEVAAKVVRLCEEKRLKREPCVLGLPTGSTPISVYSELIRFQKEEGVDFSHVVTYNLDEYYPMRPNDLQSYHRFMVENFFNYVNIPKENIHIPDGTVPIDQVDAMCAEYEASIRRDGGIDLCMMGIGRTGHIGFNEPGSSMVSRTRLVVLDEITRRDAASDFFGEENVPQQAVTMGVGTIMESREIILMAQGEGKAAVIKKAVEEEASPSMVAAYLQKHPSTYFAMDIAASMELTMEKTPWVVQSNIDWSNYDIAKQAVIWLANKVGKSILTLHTSHFQQHHLQMLLHQYGGVDPLCSRVFQDLFNKILTNDQIPTGKKIVVFSPHPDDDVICMGGMLERLRRLGNDVTVAYCTLGSLAVFDYNVERHIRFMYMNSGLVMGSEDGVHTAPVFTTDRLDSHKAKDKAPVSAKKGKATGGVKSEEAVEEHSCANTLRSHLSDILGVLRSKKVGEVDPFVIEKLKGRIRASEATAAIQVLGLPAEKARFLDLPFYKTGQIKKNPISQADVDIVYELFNELHPDIVFLAGDLSDPHGTHRMCYKAIQRALVQYCKDHFPPDGKCDVPVLTVAPVNDDSNAMGRKRGPGMAIATQKRSRQENSIPYPEVYLYRGAWIEYSVHETDFFLPLSKKELTLKIEAIYKHESQKQKAPFPGPDPREFYERAEHRNTMTAEILNKLGLPEFFAVECFVRKTPLALPSS